MNKEIQDKLDEFITSFLEVKEVKQFLILKDELASSKEIEVLKDEVRRSQKDMALSLGTSLYKEKKAYYLSKKRGFTSLKMDWYIFIRINDLINFCNGYDYFS